MSTIELQEILIHQISGIKDKSFLSALKTIIDLKSDSVLYQTTAEQRNEINEGLKDQQEGNGIWNDELMNEINLWLKEK